MTGTLPDKELLRPDEVALFFGVTRRTVYSWIDNGSLEAEKIAGVIRIPRDAVCKCRKKIEKKMKNN